MSVEVARTKGDCLRVERMHDEKQLDGAVLTQQTASAEAKLRHAFCCKFKRER